MSFSHHFGANSPIPTIRVGSMAGSIPMGSPGPLNASSSMGIVPLLQPRQGNAPRSPLGASLKTARHTEEAAFISAIDNASTKLSIPINMVEPTMAFEDDGFVPGVCRLYLEGRCRQGERCYQVHANPEVVERLRQEACNAPSCCPAHGAKCNVEGYPLGLSVIIDPPREKETATVDANAERESGSAAGSSSNGESNTAATTGQSSNSPESKVVITLHNICPTRFLWSLYTETGGMVLHVPKSKICREHRKGLCRFGNECSFLHLCRQMPLAGGEGDLLGHSRTLSRHSPAGGSTYDFCSFSPAFASASNSHCRPHIHHAQSQPQLSHNHFQGSLQFSPGSSFADSSLGNTQAGARHTTLLAIAGAGSSGARAPLLQPISEAHSPMGSMHTRGSFSHNPYSEASSF